MKWPATLWVLLKTCRWVKIKYYGVAVADADAVEVTVPVVRGQGVRLPINRQTPSGGGLNEAQMKSPSHIPFS